MIPVSPPVRPIPAGQICYIKGGVARTTIGQFWDRHRSPITRRPMNRLLCKDGFNFSAQASRDHYCSPRADMPSGSEYTAWEVGMPSEYEPLIMPYAENGDDDHWSECIYPYTPTNVVEAMIVKHGGLATDEEHQAWWWVLEQEFYYDECAQIPEATFDALIKAAP